jgi:hypothetical protein
VSRNGWMGRHHHFRFWETEIVVAQATCHAQDVRLDKTNVLSERKNFERVGSSAGQRYTQRVEFSLPP